ncbi:MAG: c-type cytochrome [Pseudomonadota bacterium]|uniref:c-type cytochrome n=1 Tax=Roseovarius TaxID=74030 RepID=UPI0022A833FC|nr:cytochrome c [Roseovarius sp. EGI FJ00037]MCZ0812501.1 cytochrome c [Roseovarius sp. EGI FJ00037]
MILRQLVLGGAAIAGLGAAAFAHSGATGVVKERMDAMKQMGEAIKRIKPMMSGEVAYDPAAVREAARAIAAESGDAMTRKFPEGTTDHPSETLPRTWEEWDRFASLAARLETAAEGLALAAGNGLHGADHMTGGQSDMMGGSMMGGQSGMMGGGMMMGDGTFPERMSAEHIGEMPADGAFMMVTQTCSACHDRYRLDDD